ncbi:J domain-containing protein [Paenibacillus tyrfis]|uniref:J domain-containing protein n=1 Tax=Paenibacillus tyrfis TaxID=1501230 RepID=UPI000B59794C|nr:J domain-containing protein [Paenibacillus tyrfis]
MDDTMKNRPDPEIITVTDDRLIPVVVALTNLTESWKAQLSKGAVSLPIAVQIGKKLSHEQQQALLEFWEDTRLPDKYMNRALHAFALNMPEWAVHQVIRIFRLTEKIRASMIMLNDLMDRFDALYEQFEHEFWEGEWPGAEEELAPYLDRLEADFQELHRQASDEKKSYNRHYGDSSSDSARDSARTAGPSRGPVSFPALIGATDDASPKELKQRYRTLMKKLHPDHGGSAYLFDWVKQAHDNYMQGKSSL